MRAHLLRLAAALLVAFPPAAAVAAATLDVTTTTDEADGSCLDGDCSLRDAVAVAAPGDGIALPAGGYLLSLGQIPLTKNLTLTGAGARATVLQGNGSARHFSINSGVAVTLQGLALTGGRGATGGSINNSGSLTLRAVALYGNQADVAGAVNSFGALTVIDSAIIGNSATSVGGVYSDLLPVRIENSTVSGNTAQLLAGGLALIGPTTLVHTTVANNRVTGKGWTGGGGFLVGDSVTIAGTVFDGNSPANCDPADPLPASASLDSDGSCLFSGSGNLVGVPAQLAALADNGGPTDTHALAATSPALELAPGCGLEHDQRGSSRPQGPACDAGAYERAAEALEPTLCATETFTSGLGALTYSAVGDADQGGAAVSGGRLQLSSDGTALYHGADNGGFLHQPIAGDFRIEVELLGFPANSGGGYRRSGLSVRTGTGPLDPRVFIEYLPQHPSYGQSALMFDYRGSDGIARELGSTKIGLALPLRLAIDRRGDKFTVWYSTGGGNWVKPAGGAGGTATIAMPATVEAGLMQASYDAAITLTSELDDFQVCRPNPAPLPPLPPPAPCAPGQPVDLVYLIDASGSSPSVFPGGPTQLDAARQAMARIDAQLASGLPGSRVAVISFAGGPAPAYTTGAGARVRSPFTADFAAAEAAAAAIDPATIHPTTSSSLTQGLAAARQLLAGAAPGSRPALVLLGDGFVNVDGDGNGPQHYKTAEMAALSLISGLAYRSVGQTAWLGNWNGPIATWDGQALADAMAAGLFLKEQLPQARLDTLGLHGASPYRLDLLGFLADYGGGDYHQASDAGSLEAAADALYAGLACID